MSFSSRAAGVLRVIGRRVFQNASPAFKLWVHERVFGHRWDNWPRRARLARASPDNAHIPRVARAGEIDGEFQIMHNGLRVQVGSYYGGGSSLLLRKNRGVHEPQEERLFQEVLKTLPHGATMIELGAYWAFYSMWFCKEVAGARAFLIEPETVNLRFGQRNFQENSLTGHFTQAFAGRVTTANPHGPDTICVDDFVEKHGIAMLDLLHSDIQGHELEMLEGAERAIRAGRIGWFFISTHSEELHRSCEEFLNARDRATTGSISPAESYSGDGILVCKSPHVPGIPPITLSRRQD